MGVLIIVLSTVTSFHLFTYLTIHIYLLLFVLLCFCVLCSVYVHIPFPPLFFFFPFFSSFLFFIFFPFPLSFTYLFIFHRFLCCYGHRIICASIFTSRRFLHTNDTKITETWTLKIILHLICISLSQSAYQCFFTYFRWRFSPHLWDLGSLSSLFIKLFIFIHRLIIPIVIIHHILILLFCSVFWICW